MIIRIRYRNTLFCIIAILMVMLSRTVYFGLINKSVFQWYFYFGCVFAVILIGINRGKMESALLKILPFLLFFILNIVAHWDLMSLNRRNELIGIILNFFVMCMVSINFKKTDFAKYYIYIIVFLALVSLPCYAVAIIDEQLAYSLCQPGYDWTTPYGYSMLYLWGWNGFISQRNAGPFWEPGAFQGFLLLAVIMLLYDVDDGAIDDRKRKWIFLLLLITIVTTGSTTGYILLLILIITQYKKIVDLAKDVPRMWRSILALFITVVAIGYIIQSGNISEKFTSSTNMSAEIRFADLAGGIAILLRNPLLGTGMTASLDLYRNSFGVSAHDSVGLLSMAYTFGLPFAMYYVYRLLKGINGFFSAKNFFHQASLVLIFLVLNLTEGVWSLPVYLYIVFYQDYDVNQLGGGKHK